MSMHWAIFALLFALSYSLGNIFDQFEVDNISYLYYCKKEGLVRGDLSTYGNNNFKL